MKPEPGWARALERAAASRTVLILGDTDSGKTSLATYLAGALAARGHAVGVVDADLGQSQIGPPTTLGLGRVARPIAALAEAERLALAWVGSTSPPGFEGALWTGTRRLVERALAAGLRPVLVDTCGLVRGALGRSVKLGKIRAVDPDLLLCLAHGDESAAILTALAAAPRPEVLELSVGKATRRRAAAERRRHREAALEAYFATAGVREVSLAALGAPPAAAPAAGRPDLEGRLVGLFDGGGETLGIGRIAGVDRRGGRLLIETPIEGAAIVRIALGHDSLRPVSDPFMR